jgi:hypothetical protein
MGAQAPCQCLSCYLSTLPNLPFGPGPNLKHSAYRPMAALAASVWIIMMSRVIILVLV